MANLKGLIDDENDASSAKFVHLRAGGGRGVTKSTQEMQFTSHKSRGNISVGYASHIRSDRESLFKVL